MRLVLVGPEAAVRTILVMLLRAPEPLVKETLAEQDMFQHLLLVVAVVALVLRVVMAQVAVVMEVLEVLA